MAWFGSGAQEAEFFRHLSLTARLAVALRCFERFCDAKQIAHLETEEFVDYLWQLPLVSGGDAFDAWVEARPTLVEVGLGETLPATVSNHVHGRGVKPRVFQGLLTDVVEIVWSSFYAAAQDDGSLDHLASLLRECAAAKIRPPDPSVFAASLFADRVGWGNPISKAECERWRCAE